MTCLETPDYVRLHCARLCAAGLRAYSWHQSFCSSSRPQCTPSLPRVGCRISDGNLLPSQSTCLRHSLHRHHSMDAAQHSSSCCKKSDRAQGDEGSVLQWEHSQHLATLNRFAALTYISEASSNLLPELKSDQEDSFFSAFSTNARALSSLDIQPCATFSAPSLAEDGHLAGPAAFFRRRDPFPRASCFVVGIRSSVHRRCHTGASSSW